MELASLKLDVQPSSLHMFIIRCIIPSLTADRLPGPILGFFHFFGFGDFLDPASVLAVSDMALLIAEVWDFYLLLNASFFFIVIFRFFIDFSLLSSPGYSLSSPGAPPDRKKKMIFS